MFTVGNTAKLFCDKLLIQQQQLQPLFLCLSFFCSLYSAYFLSIPILEWFTSFPGRKMVFLSFPFLSFPFSILSYPIVLLPISLPILSMISFRIPYPILSYPIVLLPISLPILSIISSRIPFSIPSHPILSFCIPFYFFADPILSHPFFFACPASIHISLPIPILHIYFFFAYPILSYLSGSLFPCLALSILFRF